MLQFVLDNIIEGVLTIGPAGQILQANPAASALFGYGRHELLEQPLQLLLPAELTAPQALLALSRTAGATLRGQRKDGSACAVQVAIQGDGERWTLLLRDVTQRTIIEHQIIEQQQVLRQVIDAIPNFIFVKDPSGRFVLANHSFAQQYGLTADQLIGKRNQDVVQNSGQIDLFLREDQLMRDQEQDVFIPQHQIIAPDGVSRWIQAVNRPLTIGERKHVVCVVTDITERKEAEDRLRESEEHYRSIITALEEGVILQDQQGMILACNPSAERILGLSSAQILGQAALEPGWRAVSEDGTPLPAERYPALVTLQTGQPCSNVIMGIPRPDATLRWVSMNTQPLFEAGQLRPYAVVCSFFDVTDRKAAERELELQRDFALQVMNAMGQGLTVTDRDGRFTFVNPAYAAMLGVEPAWLIGKSPLDLVVDQDQAQMYHAYQQRLAGQTSTYQARMQRAGGGMVNVLITGVPRWIDGVVMGTIAVVTDLTDQKRLEADLALARDQALEASRLKSQFVANMSHEIRTPMNGIIGMVDLLGATPITDEQSELISIIRDSAHALLTIIDDILDFSKVEAGRLELECTSFRVLDVLEGTLDLLATRAREKQLELITSASPALALPVWGDPGRLRQVLINLIGNAIKFTQAGEVVVQATCAELSAERMTLQVSIRDTGIGLAPAAQAQLFQAFVQADSSTTRMYGGTGLGLSIAKRLVELMGGEIGAESVEGSGSTFWFTVKFGASPAARLVAPPPIPGNAHVLLVTDHPTYLALLSQSLVALGVTVTSCASAQAALSMLSAERHSYQLVLINLLEAPLDGWRLAAQLHSTHQPVHSIVFTTLDELGRLDPALIDAVPTYLMRPIKPSTLQKALTMLNDSPLPPATPVADRVPQVSPPQPAPATVRILVVEDNLVNQQVITRHLQKLGYKVEIAVDGAEAVAALGDLKHGFELVLMDCQMPNMDGFTATKLIRAAEADSRRHVPIVAMTAHAMAGDREACLAVGMDDYLSKPVTSAVLHAMLQRWLAAPDQPPATAAAPELTASLLDPVILAGLRELNSPGEPDIVAILIDMFLSSAPTMIDQIRTSVAAGAAADLELAAHTLKGSASNLGATELARLCRLLEAAGASGQLAQAEDQLRAIDHEYAQLTLALERER